MMINMIMIIIIYNDKYMRDGALYIGHLLCLPVKSIFHSVANENLNEVMNL